MKVIVFGASRGVGLLVVEQLLAAGYTVTAFVRTPSKVTTQHNNLTLIQGDVLDADVVDQAIAGHDVVVSTLGRSGPAVPGMMETAAKNIVAGMHINNVRRLISTTGAGVRDPHDQPKFIDHLMGALLNLFARDFLHDSAANVKVIQASDLDWTIVRFPRLINGSRTGNYHAGYINKDSGAQISRADAAEFVVKEISSGLWVRKAPVVSS